MIHIHKYTNLFELGLTALDSGKSAGCFKGK